MERKSHGNPASTHDSNEGIYPREFPVALKSGRSPRSGTEISADLAYRQREVEPTEGGRVRWATKPGTVLAVHTYYQQRGGEDTVFDTEMEAMRNFGWDVHKLDASNFDLDQMSGAQKALGAMWSKSSAEKVRREIERVKPSIVHIHNFFPTLSPSVHWAAKEAGAAVVQTLHNFRLGCLNGAFFREGKMCTDCLGKPPVLGVIRRCYRDSLGASATVFGMLELHRARGTWHKAVDGFIALTGSARDRLIEVGIPADKLHLKPNMVYPDLPLGDGAGRYCLYVGRLTVEKGIPALMRAWESSPHLPELVVAGTGPLEPLVREAADRCANIRYVGLQPKAEVVKLMQAAGVLVFPSEWFENCPMVVLESLCVGTPVISSNLLTVKDLLSDGPHAHFFEPGKPDSIASTIANAIQSGVMAPGPRASARRRYEAAFEPKSNLAQLAEIYDASLLAASRGKAFLS